MIFNLTIVYQNSACIDLGRLCWLKDCTSLKAHIGMAKHCFEYAWLMEAFQCRFIVERVLMPVFSVPPQVSRLSLSAAQGRWKYWRGWKYWTLEVKKKIKYQNSIYLKCLHQQIKLMRFGKIVLRNLNDSQCYNRNAERSLWRKSNFIL